MQGKKRKKERDKDKNRSKTQVTQDVTDISKLEAVYDTWIRCPVHGITFDPAVGCPLPHG
jgi:hypothetical protein